MRKPLLAYNWCLSGGAFSPLSLADLEWYISASNGITTLENETAIDSWHDISPNNYNGIALTTSSHVRPTYLPTGLNGKPCADFANSDFSYEASWGSLFSKNGPITIFGKLRIDSTSAATQGILTTSPATDDRFQISITSNTQLNFAFWNGTAWAGLRHTVAANTDYYYIFQQHPGTITPRLWINGVEVFTTTTTNAGVAGNGIYVIGSVRNTSLVSQFDGKISENGLCSRIISDAEVLKLNTYLASA